MIDPRDDRPAYRQLADQLWQRISSDRWPVGHLLPSEAQLMAEFGVSRVTVRQAVAALRNQGLILTKQGIGSLVRTVQPLHRMVVGGMCQIADCADWSAANIAAERPLRLLWESVQVRMPTPQEQHDLSLIPGVPVLVLTRRALAEPGHDRVDQILEETVLPADRIVLHYRVALAEPIEPIAATVAKAGIPTLPAQPPGSDAHSTQPESRGDAAVASLAPRPGGGAR